MKQVIVVPYPGRSHVNSLLNFCHLLSSHSRFKQPNYTTIFTIVVTDEWLGFINPDPNQANIRFTSIPNVLPSELNRGSDMINFLTAVKTKMEQPFEQVLDQMELELPVELIIADATMLWPFEVANRRNIPVAAYWPMSASLFSMRYHTDLLESHHQLYLDVSERGHERIDYIPGITSLTVADIPMVFHAKFGHMFKGLGPNPLEVTKKANYILLSTIYELESGVIDGLRAKVQVPIYTCELNIPHSQIEPNDTLYELVNWLDSKPPGSVLYVSFGSFLTVSSAEMDEIAAGLRQSGISFLWVARGEMSRLKEMCGEKGMVVEWCDQSRILLHSSIGGFWTHCGWNSVKEGLFSGVPMLTFPLQFDQPLNSKAIVKDWKIGWKVKEEVDDFCRDEIARLVRASPTHLHFFLQKWRKKWGTQCVISNPPPFWGKGIVIPHIWGITIPFPQNGGGLEKNGGGNGGRNGEWGWVGDALRRFMDSKSVERIGIMERTKKLQGICHQSVIEGGSVNEDITTFLNNLV